MEGSQPHAGQGHVRNKSSTKATRPRSSTKGPLDAHETPLASPAVALRPQNAAATSAAAASSPLSPPPQAAPAHGLAPSRYVNARRTSPGPASPMGRGSNPHSPALSRGIDGSLSSPASVSAAPPRAKDFSYLLRPEIYQPLSFAAVPQPFRTSELQPAPDTPLDDLLALGYFRAAATVAAQQLTGAAGPSEKTEPIEPTDHARIFSLLYTRLACLLLLNATPLAAQEAKALEDLNSAFYLDEATGAHLVPWELRVLHVRLMALSFSDPRRAVMSYYELAREARAQIAEAMAAHDNSARELWKGRLAELGIKVAGALIEMDDLTGAAAHLASMGGGGRSAVVGAAPPPVQTAAARRLDMARALLWLQLGDADEARAAIRGAGSAGGAGGAESDGDIAPRVVAALCDMADGEYPSALSTWQALHEDAPDDEMVSVNLAVCLVYVGRMVEGRRMLEGLVEAGYSSHTLLFNLATMYELCTDRSKALKQGLAQRVADMGPSASGGWEKTNAAFKL